MKFTNLFQHEHEIKEPNRRNSSNFESESLERVRKYNQFFDSKYNQAQSVFVKVKGKPPIAIVSEESKSDPFNSSN